MSRQSPGRPRSVSFLVGVLLLSFPMTVMAQELANVEADVPVAVLALADTGAPLSLASPPLNEPARGVTTGKRGLLVPLYASFAVLQVLDVRSTRAALSAGGREANPFMKGVVESPVAFVAVKAAGAAAIIFASEKIRTRSRVGALVTMAALNGLYATIVAHNYAVRAR